MSGRFRPQFSEEQRAAVVRAVVDHEMPVPLVVYTAREEGLEGLPPFSMSPSRARQLAAAEKERRRGKLLETPAGTAEYVDTVMPRGAKLLLAVIARLEAEHEAGNEIDVGRLRQTMRCAYEVKQWTHRMGAGAVDEAEQEEKTEAEPGLLERLSKKQRKTESKDVRAKQDHAGSNVSEEKEDHAGGAGSHA